jgi:hypothetical protein
MWIGFLKGTRRTVDGKYADVGSDSGIGHRGDGHLDLREMIAPQGTHAGTAFDGFHKSFTSPTAPKPTKPVQSNATAPAPPVDTAAPSIGGSQDKAPPAKSPVAAKPPPSTPVSDKDPDDDDARLADLPAEGDSSVAWWTLGAMSENATSMSVAPGGAKQPSDDFAKRLRRQSQVG